MNKKPIFWILAVFILLITLKGAMAECNQTWIMQGQTNSSYNWTITENCTEEYNNHSFYIVALIFIFLTALVGVGLFLASKVWLKTILAGTLALMIMTLLRFGSWVISITNPAEIELINTLDHYYMFGIWGFRLTILAGVFIVLVIILNSIKMNKKKKRDNWENWDE